MIKDHIQSLISEVGLIDSTHKWPVSGGLDAQDAGLVRLYGMIQEIKIDHEIAVMEGINKGN